MPDITHIKGSDQSEPKATLDEVAAEMKHWRANKAEQGTKIPRQLCRKILYLTRRHPERAVRSLLGISKAQYDAMYNEFYALPEGDDGSVSVEFCEALPPSTTPPPSPDQHPAATQKNYPNDIPATNTVVVELYRSDGNLMKIHTTTHRFKELLTAFYEGL